MTYSNSDLYKIAMNIVAQKGLAEIDLYSELGKAQSMIHMIDQQKMTPPPVPPELIDPAMSQEPQMGEQAMGKYDNL